MKKGVFLQERQCNLSISGHLSLGPQLLLHPQYRQVPLWGRTEKQLENILLFGLTPKQLHNELQLYWSKLIWKQWLLRRFTFINKKIEL